MFAIQPKEWTAFDSYGCDWAEDLSRAISIAKMWDEEWTIWKVPKNGNAYRWMNTKK